VATWPYRDAASYLWDLRNNKSFSPLNYGGQPRYFKNDIGESTDALGLMVVRNKVYISMPYENKLLVLDAETGASLNDDIPINSPVGLCALDDHTLLAVSGTTVVKVDTVYFNAPGRARQHHPRPAGAHLRERLGKFVSGEDLRPGREIPSCHRQARRTALGG